LGWGPTPQTVPTTEAVPDSITIDRAARAFLAEREESAAPNTQRKNRYVLNALKANSESKGYVLIEQWTTMDVREFRASWEVAPNTAAKYLEIAKSFFEFAVSNGWIAVSPAKPVRNTKGKATDGTKERIPFSDEEIRRMFDACDHQYGKMPIRWSREVHHRPARGETANYRHKWTGQDLADFIAISIYTGLRISDVATFHIDRLHEGGECDVRTTKTGRKVSTWIPEWLQTRIRVRAEKHDLWQPFDDRHQRHHRHLAPQVESSLEPLRAVEGEADAPSIPAYLRPHTTTKTGRDRARCCRAYRRHRGYDPSPLRRVGRRTTGAAYKNPQRNVRREAKAQGGVDSPLRDLIAVAITELLNSSRVQQSGVYPACSGFRDAVSCMRLLPSHADLYDSWISFTSLRMVSLPRPHIRASSPTR
jgi:hypothetical protein